MKKEKAAPPNLSCSNGFYDDTWPVIMKIEFCACCIVNNGRGEAVLLVVFVLVILDL